MGAVKKYATAGGFLVGSESKKIGELTKWTDHSNLIKRTGCSEFPTLERIEFVAPRRAARGRSERGGGRGFVWTVFERDIAL